MTNTEICAMVREAEWVVAIVPTSDAELHLGEEIGRLCASYERLLAIARRVEDFVGVNEDILAELKAAIEEAQR